MKPEQLKDQAYVLSLKQSLAQSKAEGRLEDMGGRIRASNAPVFSPRLTRSHFNTFDAAGTCMAAASVIKDLLAASTDLICIPFHLYLCTYRCGRVGAKSQTVSMVASGVTVTEIACAHGLLLLSPEAG